MKAKGHISQAILGFSTLPLIYYNIENSLPININDNLYNIITDNYYFYHYDNISTFVKMLFMLFFTILGVSLPDIDFNFKYLYPPSERNKMLPRYHRQITHSLLLNLSIFIYIIYSGNTILFYIWLGVIIHLIGDMFTGSIPILLWGKYYIWPARIGIDRFLPQSIKVSIHNKIANTCEKYWYIAVFLAFFIYFYTNYYFSN